jgi:hypothetical protein
MVSLEDPGIQFSKIMVVMFVISQWAGYAIQNKSQENI